MQTQKKNASVNQVLAGATLRHETAKSSTSKKNKDYLIYEGLEKLRFLPTSEERIKNRYYEQAFSHEISSLQYSFKRYKVPTQSSKFMTWTLQWIENLLVLEACYRTDLLILKVTQPKMDYSSLEFEEILRASKEMRDCMVLANRKSN